MTAENEGGKEVAVKQNTDVALPAGADEFSEVAGQGFEGITARELLIPRVTILQDMSPQLKQKKAEYVEGAEVGMICEIASKTLYGDNLLFLPAKYICQFLEWAPRASGKGLIAIHNDPEVLDACTRDDKNRPITQDGNLMSETAQYFGFIVNRETLSLTPAFIPMSATALKRARGWNHLYTSEKLRNSKGDEFTPPIYYRAYELSVVEESNNEGEWFGWRIERGPTMTELWKDDWRSIKELCEKFGKDVAKGRAAGDHETGAGMGESESDDAPM